MPGPLWNQRLGGTDNVMFLDQGASYMDVFSL